MSEKLDQLNKEYTETAFRIIALEDKCHELSFEMFLEATGIKLNQVFEYGPQQIRCVAKRGHRGARPINEVHCPRLKKDGTLGPSISINRGSKIYTTDEHHTPPPPKQTER